MINRFVFRALSLASVLVLGGYGSTLYADETKSEITLASTTSTQNSGLFDYLLPLFKEQTGIEVHVVAVGTGAALKLARNGDADVLMVHHKTSEETFVSEGYGVERFDVMYNDFVLVGPDNDPSGVKETETIVDALGEIKAKQAIFLSRGDDSGTNKRELELWKANGDNPKTASGSWYRETGSGMGATLNTAVAMQGYTLSDRATWISYKNKQNMEILFEGDERLFNQYGVIVVNPEKFPHVKEEAAKIFVNWLLSEEGQSTIASYKVSGQQLFIPDAK
ncbi:sulfate transporter [Kiloniella spongiae]|uniref:Sulfate transporter n=1 Tax=Kiloniella spongiae TaxID=1489064 RepID=A0A0H2MGA1_9PROT|nr:substrate-binding domain-containing protein [Kiloniella spongiae]KLN59782.1 sulfate transporter [Kiloniella spongiae]